MSAPPPEASTRVPDAAQVVAPVVAPVLASPPPPDPAARIAEAAPLPVAPPPPTFPLTYAPPPDPMGRVDDVAFYAEEPSGWDALGWEITDDYDPWATPQAVREARRRKWNNRFAAVLAVVATACVGLGVVSAWADRTILDTGSFVDTTLGSVEDPVVVLPATAALQESVTASLRPSVVDQSQDLEAPFVSLAGFDAALTQATLDAIASPAYTEQWRQALTTTQVRELERIRAKQPPPPSPTVSLLSVDLTPLATQIRDSLASQGYEAVAGAVVTPVAFTTSTTGSIDPYLGVLAFVDTWWWAWWILAVAAGAGAYALSSRRLRLTLFLGVDLMLAMGAVHLTSRLWGQVAGERGVTPQDVDVLSALYEPLGAGLSRTALIVGVIGALIAFGAILGLVIRSTLERRVGSSRSNAAGSPY